MTGQRSRGLRWLFLALAALAGSRCFTGLGRTSLRPSRLATRADMAEAPGDIKTSLRIIYDGDPCMVLEFQSKRVGKGVGKTGGKLKNCRNGAIVPFSMSSGSKWEKWEPTWSSGTYSYNDGGAYFFMDSESFEEVEVQAPLLGELTDWLKEGAEVKYELYEGQVVQVKLVDDVEMLITKVVQRKDNQKDCRVELENGNQLFAPSYFKEGDTMVIHKETFKILKRA
eukprot:CAMPEP_0197653244 /NCGR_PEP_ID=MMETSP1338-20131121/34940_1 /TAXON_ID=43686 ORGANISM="Pelagodinium beii, Strain RCC1491" /NCGR_SAMPLE_ID=MMETSP1338 /ASSEMBLY_ACC=CAM_ASM_000754 /LENGTH=225 /DNA_ID=CAMNT_0043228285 /DNA_START=23 /DNA_END=700 /DNA_ORIENTATION=+